MRALRRHGGAHVIDWKGQTVFVSGATGFVGAHLAAELVRRGADVISLERDHRPVDSLRALGFADRVTTVRGDLCDATLLERVFNEFDVKFAFHLAAQALVGPANHSPLSTFESNIRGSWSLYEAARRAPSFRALVIASSDKAYGVHTQLPYREDFPLNGRFPYDASKVCTEILAQSYAASFDLPLAITRNANTYGPGDLNFSRLIPDSIRCGINGDPVQIRSDGRMLRDYLYVSDAVEGYLLLASALSEGRARGEAFNFGTGEAHSVLTVCQRVLDLIGNPNHVAPQILNKVRCEIPEQYLDASKAETIFGWKAKVGLDEGLRQTVTWYRAFLLDSQ